MCAESVAGARISADQVRGDLADVTSDYGAGVRIMRKVVAYELISLDGVAESPDDFITEWDDSMHANLARVIATQDAVILGHRSYEEWSRFWPTSEIQPFASFINSVSKYVATTTALQSEWRNTSVIEGDLATMVGALSARTGGDIGVHASISVIGQLLAAGIVNELQLVVAPRVIGRGRRLFDGVPPLQLSLISSETSPTGYWLGAFRVENS